MGLTLTVVNHDELLEETPGNKIFVNDFNLNSLEDKEQFDRLFYTHYRETDVIESTVSCDCGGETEAYKLGVTCNICHTEVVRISSRPVRPSMWIRAPEGVTSLISPQLWIMLSGYLTKKDFDFLEYLTNTSYKYDIDQINSNETKRRVERLILKDFPRGLNNFIENFDEIIDFLMNINAIGIRKNEFRIFLENNKQALFPKVIPIPNKLLFVVESTTSGVYIDKPIGAAVDAILTIAGIENSITPIKPIVVQNRTARALKLMSIFHDNYGKNRIAKKPGMIRKHILGSRLNLTARAVITSISEPHDYDEIHIPWGIACQLLKYHIVNKLKKKFKMTAREALAYVYANAVKYNKELDDIFKELIKESKYKGLPCILARNPTLQRGSTQFLYISKVLTDPKQQAIRISVNILRGPNADFDGDQLNLTLINDNDIADVVMKLAPHNWVLDPNTPHELSGNLKLQDPTMETIVRYIHDDYLPPLEEWQKQRGKNAS